ncbi:MAG: TolC family protein [Salinibacter sp.]|uniref:TolC family protein n=1 Tax=Salinibacter sp. TaxID=2065818 RepID=UPI0035D44C43
MFDLSLVRSLVAATVAGVLVGAGGDVVAQSSGTAPADTVEVSLEEALVRALEESPEVAQRRAQEQFATARRDEARANRFLTDVSLDVASSFAPGLTEFGGGANTVPDDLRYLHPSRQNDWSIDALRPFGRFEIAVRQPIWTWGELSGNIRAARHGVDVETARVDQKALEVAARAGKTYYSLLLTKALDRLADQTRDVVDRAQREINRLLDKGDKSVSQADLFQTRLTEEEVKRRIVEIEQNRATARSALRRQLFLSDGTTVMPAADELQPISFSIHPDSLDYYITRALQNRPEVDQAEAGVKAREALVDVAKSDYYPKIGVQASLSQSITLPDRPNPDNAFVGDSFMGTGTRTGIGIQQNLNFGQTSARVEQAQAELDKVKHQRTAARQLVRVEVEEAYRSLLTAKTNVESRDRAETISGEWLRTEQVNFDLDLGDTEDLVKAVRADLEAQARYLEAVKQYNVAVLKLLRTTGTLADRARSGTLLEKGE